MVCAMHKLACRKMLAVPLRAQGRSTGKITRPTTICTRQFSATTAVQRAPKNQNRNQNLRHNIEHPPSPAASKKKIQQQSEKDILKYRQDIGLVPMTWIPHTGSNKTKAFSTLYSKPRLWWKFYRNWFSFTVAYWYRTFQFRSTHFGTQLKRKNRQASSKTRPDRKAIEASATKLHSDMFSALARLDKETVDAHCLQGLKVSMLQRIDARARNELYDWKAQNVKAKLVSYRIMSDGLGITNDKPICLQQAVVRIESTQQLRRGTSSAPRLTAGERERWFEYAEAPDSLTWSDPVATDKVEYFVIQRKLVNLEPQGQWKIWGFAQETTIDNFESTIVKGQDLDQYMKKKQNKEEEETLQQTIEPAPGRLGSRRVLSAQ